MKINEEDKEKKTSIIKTSIRVLWVKEKNKGIE